MSTAFALKRVISGGQTGADQGGLMAGRELGIPTGGIAPKGWLTEHGPEEAVLRNFGLVECGEEGYSARTRANIVDSDGTLLVGPCRDGGSALTLEFARTLDKPLFQVAYAQGNVIEPAQIKEFRDWLQRSNIHILNVAGSRESDNPGIQEFTQAFLRLGMR